MTGSGALDSNELRPRMTDRPAAVALAYDGKDAAPRVVAQGYGTVAENIIRKAHEHGLHVHESAELVSVLMRLDLDSQIPPALYEAVAGLLAWLYRLECTRQDAPAARD